MGLSLVRSLRGTHASSANSSGGPLVAAALLGDIPAAWHLATSTEAADRGLAMRLSDEIYSPGAGVQYTSLKRIANPRSAASVLVARCQAAGTPPMSSAATYRLPLAFAELVWVPRRF